eukprot:SAG22_NODE_7331_length_751_cov_0.705521_1_plen_53_part_10
MTAGDGLVHELFAMYGLSDEAGDDGGRPAPPRCVAVVPRGARSAARQQPGRAE